MKQTILGIAFLLLGFIIALVSIVPMATAALHSTAFTVSWVGLGFLCVGISVGIFGAWLIPSSNAGVVFTQFTVALGKTNLPFVGGRRSTDVPVIDPSPSAKP